MKLVGKTPALLGILIALTAHGGLADPLHKFGNEGAWVHVDSGWRFPKEVGDFGRVTQPYNIDGNNDAGAEYRQAQVSAEVDVYAADSAAVDATIEGAKDTAARKAGEGAQVRSEKPFQVAGLKGGVKITYAPKSDAAGVQTNLYYFTTDRWRVKVLATTEAGGELALDEFVRALPWNTLGTDSGIH
ncbi:MAG TPA: hypothetical protein VGD45_28775 [Steroidobacter sp.]|uniref:hypothetical protein n=1 Tax=Steroidobacter sp. TaxID=1978227 RepID=UPI002ED807E9